MNIAIVKAHAYGNDFLLAEAGDIGGNGSMLAKRMCDRHQGVGADGLLLFGASGDTMTMKLFNADGSASELSGNGLRCLAALIARQRGTTPGTVITVETDAGRKSLTLLGQAGPRYTFRAAMGVPEDIRQVQIPVLDETVTASILRMGNPQCVVLGNLPDAARFNRFGPALSAHAMFPAGTNVEFARVEAPDRVRIVVWERGVGPTTSSGTGASAAAVAAAAHGGASRDVEVIAPGGSQRVEWQDDGVYLTGWAEIVLEGRWIANVP